MDETKGNEGTAAGAGAPSVSSGSLEMTPVVTAAPPERAAVPREKDYDWGRTLGEGTFGTVRVTHFSLEATLADRSLMRSALLKSSPPSILTEKMPSMYR
jgi:hypothetical protein